MKKKLVRILGPEGDERVDFATEEECRAIRERVGSLCRQGRSLFGRKEGEKEFRSLKAFDPEMDEQIVIGRMVGG